MKKSFFFLALFCSYNLHPPMIFSLVLFLFYLLTVIVGGPSRKMKMKKRCMMKHRRFIMGKIDPFYLYSSSCSASETIFSPPLDINYTMHYRSIRYK
jgi:hypothetical protein